METRLTDMTCALPREAWVADCAFGEVPAKPAGGWRILDYTCKEYAGRMLTTCQPEAAVLTIPLGLTGWHAVSIGIVCFWCEGVLDVRLTYQTIDVAEYARALAGTGVPVYPSLGDCNDHRRGLGEYFRRAHNYYQQGADGLSRWDTGPHLARIGLDSPARVALWSEIYQLAKMKQTQDCGVTFVDIGGIPQGPFQPGVGL